MKERAHAAAAQSAPARNLTVCKAIAEALLQEMRADPTVVVFGEDVASLGGVFATTQGLLAEFGAARVYDTPISEAAFIGAAVGMATSGLKPVVELMFVDFVGVCLNSIYNLAAKNCYFSGGAVPVPMVLMTSVGGGYSDAAQHSQCLYATFGHLPGLKVVIPANAHDAKGLMIAAIRDPNPVVFMFHKALQGMGWLSTLSSSIVDVPSAPFEVPIGQARIAQTGTDVTIVTLGATVHAALVAAEKLAATGISAEVVDLRTIAPLDRATIVQSVRKTGRLISADEDYASYGVAAEVIASACEDDAVRWKAAPVRIAYPDVPPPFAPVMEQALLPDADKIVAAVHRCMRASQ
jgi:acetoin:2,6-dichlorophenolindophenol oxidoreductase subunit beta